LTLFCHEEHQERIDFHFRFVFFVPIFVFFVVK